MLPSTTSKFSPSTAQRSTSLQLGRRLQPFIGLLLGLALWWLASATLSTSVPVLASFSPANTFQALLRIIGSGTIFASIAWSLMRVAIGLGVATLLGVIVGVIIGFMRPVERSVSPLFQFLRMVSPISWMPVAVMTLGIGNPSVIFLIAMAAVWPVLFNTVAAVKALDKNWLNVSKSLGATKLETLRKVVVPAILPQVRVGLRIALGLAWVVLVPAEMLGVQSGLGYAILDARDRLAYDEVMAIILVIGLIGYLLDSLLKSGQDA